MESEINAFFKMIQRIREQVPLTLELHDGTVIDDSTLVAFCYMCSEDDIVVNLNTKSFHCTHCCNCGDITTYIMQRDELTFKQAITYLVNKYKLDMK
jgi:hypothetical protein